MWAHLDSYRLPFYNKNLKSSPAVAKNRIPETLNSPSTLIKWWQHSLHEEVNWQTHFLFSALLLLGAQIATICVVWSLLSYAQKGSQGESFRE